MYLQAINLYSFNYQPNLSDRRYNQLSFNGYSYESFLKRMKQANLNLSKIKQQCISENIKGTGANSIVYKFSSPELSNWVIKVFNGQLGDWNNLTKIEKVKDEFGEINIGQAIARIGSSAQILKRVEGVEHSLPNWSKRNSSIFTTNPITRAEALDFAKSIKSISEFPLESYTAYARELKCLNDSGYKADSFNPNNLLIDYKNKAIHIIDAYKYELDENRNTKYDLICPLLDFTHYGKYWEKLENKSDFIADARKIFAKCTQAAQLEGVNLSEKTYIDFVADVDSRLNLNGLYSGSYQVMKKLCGF